MPVQQAWTQMVARYGQPAHLDERCGRGFAVVGWRQVGRWELGYSSDLRSSCMTVRWTSDQRRTRNRRMVVYLRLAQRIMYLPSTRTSPAFFGSEVDASTPLLARRNAGDFSGRVCRLSAA